jgi:hypothetical protein
MFGLLKIRKSYSKAAYRLRNRILELTSVFPIAESQHDNGFVSNTQNPIKV